MGTVGIICAVVGSVGAGLLRWLPLRGRTDGLTAAHLAMVRGGPRAALVVVVVELHLAGAVAADRHGRLRRVVHAYPRKDATPLHRAVRTALSRALSCADAAVVPTVRRARKELRADLARRGLLCGRGRQAAAGLVALAAGGSAVAAAAHGAAPVGIPLAVASFGMLFVPGRTLAGWALLGERRRRHPLPAADAPRLRAAQPDGGTALLVALHGRRALRRLLPGFAAETGLLGGRAARDTVARSGHDCGPDASSASWSSDT
ncbi:TIGR04222 domain-containing membrane protein [Kitasatospora hibisci]|uniref:TIGR04222 domain-containing membrane protein n=1 Tax=Kitasatospora hibisci TaxID=3369522 RepID=UPI003754C2E6